MCYAVRNKFFILRSTSSQGFRAMELQRLLPLVLLTFTTWFAINYFFPTHQGDKAGPAKAGYMYKAPSSSDIGKPLMRDVDIVDAQATIVGATVPVELPRTDIQLTTAGASFTSLTYKPGLYGKSMPLTAYIVSPEAAPEVRPFFVAFTHASPYAYTLTNRSDEEVATGLTFTSETPDARITKQYMFDHATYSLGVSLTIEPLPGRSVQPRLFIPVQELDEEDASTLYGFVRDHSGSFVKTPHSKVGDEFWVTPSLVGVSSSYFVTALVSDKDTFAKRAYFSARDSRDLSLILEGPEITEKTSWHLEFYCGPKEYRSIKAVNADLTDVLEFGWLAPITALLMRVLDFIFGLVGNYGVAIILLTLVLRLLIWPFSLSGTKGQKKREEMMQKMKLIEIKYKHDPEALQKAKVELVQKYGIFPGGMGCLPLLLQIPIFIGLQHALRTSIQLYKAPFFGWITDLSQADPYYILPLLGALALYVHIAPTLDKKHRVGVLFAAAFVFVMSMRLSAGLALFMVCSIVFGFVQTFVQKRIARA